MSFDEVASAFGASHYRGPFWRFRCPCHDDKEPSAELWDKDGRVMFGCWVCTPPQMGTDAKLQVKAKMLQAVGLNWDDVGPKKAFRKPRHGKITATYDYINSEGEVLYRKVRIEPGSRGRKKDFFIESPDNGGWKHGLHTNERVIYRYLELSETLNSDPDTWVWLCAGEKDADNGALVGLATTTTIEGEGSFPQYAADQLQGCRVVILPDRDETGWRHAGHAMYMLRKRKCTVRLLDAPGLPEGGDLTDFLNRQGSKPSDRLLACMKLLRAGTEYQPF